jgi:hypothetical protein
VGFPLREGTSREILALVFYDLLKYIVKNRLGVVWLRYKLAETHNVTTLFNEVLQVVIAAFVGQLCHLDAL